MFGGRLLTLFLLGLVVSSLGVPLKLPWEIRFIELLTCCVGGGLKTTSVAELSLVLLASALAIL
jgi:hypothetical protein